MSHELHIHKIGPVNDCRLAHGNFTILTGPQANGKSTAAKLLAGQTVKFIFLETGMISVMPVPLLAAHPWECSPQGRTRYVPSAYA